MKIYGLQKTTLLDYPGHIAATIFTGGCNFRCPFCHNKDLIFPRSNTYDIEELLHFLENRVSVLEGVCITGGEPTLQPGLADFIQEVKKLNLLVKLDTNGYLPDVLISLCESNLLDYVAMDIKTSKERYPIVAGVDSFELSRIETSVDYLLHSSVPYEFRTTVVKELHTIEDFQAIGPWLQGCKNYFLQAYCDGDTVLNPGFHPNTKEELTEYAGLLRPYMEHVAIRGL